MRIRKIITLLIILVSLMTTFIYCGEENNFGAYESIGSNKNKADTEANVKNKTTKIGVAIPLTGNLSYYGESILNGAVMVAEEVNKRKSKKDKTAGLFGQPVEIISSDTGTDSQRAVKVAEKLLFTDNVLSISGACDSSIAMSMNDIIKSSDTVLISPTANAESLVNSEDSDNLFHLSTSTEDISSFLSNKASNKDKDYKYTVVIHQNNVYGKNFAESFAKKFRRTGRYCDVFSYDNYDFVHKSLTDKVKEALDKNKERKSGILIIGYPEDIMRILKQFSEQNVKTEFFFGEWIESIEIFKDFGIDLKYLEGSWGVISKPYKSSYKKDFDRLYKRKFKTEPTLYTYKMYDATAINILALAEAGKSAKNNDIKKAVEKVTNSKGTKVYAGKLRKGIDLIKDGKDINYVGLSGNIEFDSKGTYSKEELSLWKIKDAKMIDPEKIKKQKDKKETKNKKDKKE